MSRAEYVCRTISAVLCPPASHFIPASTAYDFAVTNSEQTPQQPGWQACRDSCQHCSVCLLLRLGLSQYHRSSLGLLRLRLPGTKCRRLGCRLDCRAHTGVVDASSDYPAITGPVL